MEQAPPLLACQRSADGPLTLWQILHVIRERSPSAAELQHPRQHADIHVDRAIRDAGVVTGTLEVGDCRRRDRGEPHVAEVLLDDAKPLFLDTARSSLGRHRPTSPAAARAAAEHATDGAIAAESRPGDCAGVGAPIMAGYDLDVFGRDRPSPSSYSIRASGKWT